MPIPEPSDIDAAVLQVLADQLCEVDEMYHVQGYVLIAAVHYLESDETRFMSLAPEGQPAWQSLGLLDTAKTFEQARIVSWVDATDDDEDDE